MKKDKKAFIVAVFSLFVGDKHQIFYYYRIQASKEDTENESVDIQTILDGMPQAPQTITFEGTDYDFRLKKKADGSYYGEITRAERSEKYKGKVSGGIFTKIQDFFAGRRPSHISHIHDSSFFSCEVRNNILYVLMSRGGRKCGARKLVMHFEKLKPRIIFAKSLFPKSLDKDKISALGDKKIKVLTMKLKQDATEKLPEQAPIESFFKQKEALKSYEMTVQLELQDTKEIKKKGLYITFKDWISGALGYEIKPDFLDTISQIPFDEIMEKFDLSLFDEDSEDFQTIKILEYFETETVKIGDSDLDIENMGSLLCEKLHQKLIDRFGERHD